MNMAPYLRFLRALVFVLGLIALLVWAVRRFGLDAVVLAGATTGPGSRLVGPGGGAVT